MDKYLPEERLAWPDGAVDGFYLRGDIFSLPTKVIRRICVLGGLKLLSHTTCNGNTLFPKGRDRSALYTLP